MVADAGQTATIPYPSPTTNLHPEIELVVALGLDGRNIRTEDVAQHICGYAVGLAMTRRALQTDMKEQDRPGASARPTTTPRPWAPSPRCAGR